MPKTICLAFTGASGMPYGMRLLECLLAAECRVQLLYSQVAQVVARQEMALDLPAKASEAQALLRQRYAAHFEQCGVNGLRLDFLERTPDTRSHLACYNGIDIALDTAPYNGTTTTCESLWMGVPVVTLAGDRHMARVGASL